jgi:hypothetical protein
MEIPILEVKKTSTKRPSPTTKEKNKLRSKEWRNNQRNIRMEHQESLNQLAQLKLENEQLKLENQKLEQQIGHLKLHCKQLDGHISELESLVSSKMKQWELETELLRKIVSNTSNLIVELPYNSPFHRPLLFFFTNGLSFKEAKEFYSISKRTFGRVQQDDGGTFMNQLYAINNTKTRITTEQMEEIKRILADILPVQSGRNWSYQEITNKKLYEQYQAAVKHGKPVSKTYFFYSVLKKMNIHHSKKMKFCPICEQIEDGNESEEVQQHLELVSTQRLAYMKDKMEIASGRDFTTALVTQDFTQIELESGFVQDLIINFVSTLMIQRPEMD